MARDTFVVVANEYDTDADALADYEDVRKVFDHLGLLDHFDAVVVTRAPTGRSRSSGEWRNRRATARGRDWRSDSRSAP